MNTRSLIIASVLLCVAAGLVIYDRHATKKRETEDTSGRERILEGLEVSDITSFEYVAAVPEETSQEEGGPASSALSRLRVKAEYVVDDSFLDADVASEDDQDPDQDKEAEDAVDFLEGSGAWRVVEPMVFAGDGAKIERLLKTFLEYRYDSVFPVEEDRWKVFGIDEERSAVLRLQSAHEQEAWRAVEYTLGAQAPVGFKMYLYTSLKPGHVYFGPRSSILTQKYTLEDFLDLSLPSFSSSDSVVEVKVLSGGGSKGGGNNKAQESFKETFVWKDPQPTVGAEDTSKDGDIDLFSDEERSLVFLVHQGEDQRPSPSLVGDFLDAVSGVKAETLASESLSELVQVAQQLTVTVQSSSQAAKTLRVFSHQGAFYVEKQGKIFTVKDGESIRPYFALRIEDLTLKTLPLLVQSSLQSVEVVDASSRQQRTYRSQNGGWLATDAAAQESSQDPNDQDQNTDKDEDKDDKEEAAESATAASAAAERGHDHGTEAATDAGGLREDLSQFVFQLYGVEYEERVTANPSDLTDLLYTVELKSAPASGELWHVYGVNSDDALWLQRPDASTVAYYKVSDLRSYLQPEPEANTHTHGAESSESSSVPESSTSANEAEEDEEQEAGSLLESLPTTPRKDLSVPEERE